MEIRQALRAGRVGSAHRAGNGLMSSPRKRIVPEEGGKSPVMQLNSVVLPAPFEPRTARRSPGRTVMVTISAPRARRTAASRRAAPAPGAGAEKTGVARRYPWLPPPRRIGAVSLRWRHRSHSPTTPSDDQNTMARKPSPIKSREAIAVEPELDQHIECKGAQDNEDERSTNQGPMASAMPPTTAMIKMSMQAPTLTEPVEDLPVVPDLQGPPPSAATKDANA